MGGSSSTEISGVRVFKVSPGSPAAEAGLEVFFDFILEINGIKMDPSGQQQFAKVIADSENGHAKLQVFNTRAHTTREVIVNPRKWAGSGLLGATVRYDVVDPAENHGIRVLEVFPNSPAAHAGLVPFQDYLLGTAQRVFHDIDELVEVVNADLGNRIQVYVYNSDHETVREATLSPNNDWGGDGCIGCDIGTGLLHRIPAPRRNPASRPVLPQVAMPGAVAYAPGVLPAPVLPQAAYPPGTQAPLVAYPGAAVPQALVPGVAPQVQAPQYHFPDPTQPQIGVPGVAPQVPAPTMMPGNYVPQPPMPTGVPAPVAAVPQYAPAAVVPTPVPTPVPVPSPTVPAPLLANTMPAVAPATSPVVPAPALVPTPASTVPAVGGLSPSEELLALQARIQQLGAGTSVPPPSTLPSVPSAPITTTPSHETAVAGIKWPPQPQTPVEQAAPEVSVGGVTWPPAQSSPPQEKEAESPLPAGSVQLPAESLASPMSFNEPRAPPSTPFNPHDAPPPIDFTSATMNFSGAPSIASMPQIPSVPTPTPPGASSLM
mmetsp:Transcript_35977/g.57312  ORF Transcript_35977/g.57312 Transcript_35977/m.57312 type:complete len:544 (+) Transcript_35977:104-1735(+)|eukprot:CAMPEP_0169100928 /NCGR_PEP_ID=MMETSP1015-20121227/21356_1 /TAXON_ID=342587 /ORGANISM="Karlodinium micrum, Strain CCMP2283" /LENGTH=543 /DNA_ID=CAMNT_0009161917 /DNA_START=100 /DNA_END=1731 /DNA_ORIENTATION=-